MEVICFEDRSCYTMVDKLEAYIDGKKPKHQQITEWYYYHEQNPVGSASHSEQ